MKKTLIVICLLAVCHTMAAKQRVAVFQCWGGGSGLSAKDLKDIRFDIEKAGNKILSKSGEFAFIPFAEVDKTVDEEALQEVEQACTDGGNCMRNLAEKANANYGTWCEVKKADGKLTLYLQLFDADKESGGTIYTNNFKDLKNAAEVLKIIGNEAPAMFETMIKKSPEQLCDEKGKGWIFDNGECKSSAQMDKEICEQAQPGNKWRDGVCKSEGQLKCEVMSGRKWIGDECKTNEQIDCEKKEGRWENNACKTKAQIERENCIAIGNTYINGVCKEPVFTPPPMPQQAAGGGNYFSAYVKTRPAEATLLLNGERPQNCPKTPCYIQSYKDRIRLTVSLSEYKTVDTTFTITSPNQQVDIKLDPKTYTVQFESTPSGALLDFENNYACQKTPCRAELKKGNVKVKASMDLYDTKDTNIFISGEQRVLLNMNRNYGTMNIKTKGEGWKLMIDNKYSSFNDIKLLPGNYKAKLTHECYEEIDFNAHIKKATDEVFDLTSKAVLKCGLLEVKSTYEGGWTLDIGGRDYRSLNEIALMPGIYKAKLTHELFEDINFDTEVKKGQSTVFDIASKKVPRYGYLEIKSSDNKYEATVGGKHLNLQSSNKTMLLPGTYKVQLKHETPECYEDINFDAEIKRGELASFDVSDKIKQRTATLALYVKYKGRNQKEPVFIDGKEIGSTPFKESIPVCSNSQAAELGNEKTIVSLQKLKLGEGVEYTHNLPTWKSTLLSLAIGSVSAVFLYSAYSNHAKANDYVDDYNKLNSSYPLEYERLRKKATDAQAKVPRYLISSGALAVTAVGVYLWF